MNAEKTDRKRKQARAGRPLRARYNTERLAAARDLMGLTNRVIAAATGISPCVLSRLFNGVPGNQSPKTVATVANFLRVPMAEIVLTVASPTPPDGGGDGGMPRPQAAGVIKMGGRLSRAAARQTSGGPQARRRTA